MFYQLFNFLAVKMAIIAGISGFAGLLLCLFCVSKIRLVSLALILVHLTFFEQVGTY